MITNERFITLFLNLWEYDIEGNSLDDIVDLAQTIGMKRSEFIELISETNFIPREGWAPEENERKRNIKNVNVGDSDQAILETALTQVGIEYEYHNVKDGADWIELKETNGYYSVEIHFDNNGKFLELLC